MSTKRELHLDLETRATADLLKTGSYKYFEHPQTDVICACFAVDDEPVQTWRRGDPEPDLWRQAVQEGWLIFGHNVGFERGGILNVLGPRYGWSIPEDENYRCTAAMAAAMSLPRALGNAAAALDMEVQKDAVGKRLMLEMCKPRKVEGKTVTWWEEDDKMDRLVAYCITDVEVERQLTKRLRPLTDVEQQVWLLDLHINSRGIGVDVESVRRARVVVDKASAALNAELARLTGYKVMKVTEASNLADWLIENGVDLPVLEATEKQKKRAEELAAIAVSAMGEGEDEPPTAADFLPAPKRAVDKPAIRKALLGDYPPNVRRVLEIRQEAAKSSTAKLKSFLERVSDDGRVRENLMYHGAGTGRWSGKGVQLQNVPRPAVSYPAIEFMIDMLVHEDPAYLALICSPMEGVASMLRSLIIAKFGHEFLTADYSNIEGRVLAWLAGEEWKLQAFRDFDAGIGPDIYLTTAATIYGVPVTTLNKKSPERQVGKVAELAYGFQGADAAFQAMASIYDVVVEDGTANQTKLAWRAKHLATVQFWRDLEKAAMAAVLQPGKAVWAGDIATSKIGFLSRKGVLWMQLPSGRRLAYIQPHVKEKKAPWKDRDGKDVWLEQVHFMGVDAVTKAWSPQSLYGGLLAENATQAVARDLMAEAMLRMENECGWDVVLTVHDEIICEVPEGTVTVEEFEREMAKLPSWCPDLPLVAEGDRTKRYRK